MTKKHFIAIAASINDVRESCSDSPETVWALDEVSNNIADVCADTNPNFDRERFLEACGVEA